VKGRRDDSDARARHRVVMRVTVEIEDELHRRSKQEARRLGVTLGQFAEGVLRRFLDKSKRKRARVGRVRSRGAGR